MTSAFVVGLTGGIGSGKSTVAEHFQQLGVTLIDADLIAREVVTPGSPALERIAQHFGEDFIDTSGELRRGQLRQLIFADPAAKAWLENLLHPLIGDRIRLQIGQAQSSYCILVSPLLLETDQRQLVDRVLVIDVEEQTQLSRTLARDGSDAATIEAIMAAQIGRDDRLRAADDILDNEVPLEQLADAVASLHQRYLELAREHGGN